MTSPEEDSNAEVPAEQAGVPAKPDDVDAARGPADEAESSRAGYDVRAVSGDTAAVRPE